MGRDPLSVRPPNTSVVTVVALILSVCLGGCYESKEDLIGEHAVAVRRLDSVLIYKNSAYLAAKVGAEVALCPLRTRSDVTPSCTGNIFLKIERTTTGNYIVQVREKDHYHYALWVRSEPGAATQAGSVCIMWFGEGIVGSNALTSVPYIFADDPTFASISAELSAFNREALDSRKEMLKVAEIYERNAANAPSDKWKCIGERVLMTASQTAIAGDNRDLPSFTNAIK